MIDSKAPFDAFERAANAASDEERTAALAEFARKVRQHVQELGRKGVLGARHAVTGLHVHVPARRRLPRGCRGAGCGALRASRTRRGVLITTPRTIVVMLRTIRVGVAERERVGARRDRSEGRVGAARAAQHDGRPPGEGRPRARLGRQRVQQGGRLATDHASSSRHDGSRGSRRHGRRSTTSLRSTEHASSQLQPLQLEVVPKDADAA